MVNHRVNLRAGGKENPETECISKRNRAERTPDSRSPGQETLAPKFSARMDLKNRVFGQSNDSGVFLKKNNIF